MKVSELNPIIAALYNAGTTGMFWGAPGIGKSTAFRAAAEILRKQIGLTGPVLERHQVKQFIAEGGDIRTAFGLFDVRLSQSDPVDVGGLPRENKATGSMERLPPSWFPHFARNDLPNYGILLLDELPSAPLSVQTTAYQITLDGVIDEHRIKDGWAVFAAGNRVTDGGQFFKMPYALANRMCHIDVESNLDSWLDWAIAKGVDHSLVAFMQFKPDLLNCYEDHAKNKKAGMAFATERMWEKVDDLLQHNQGIDQATLQAILGGLVGGGPAAEYMAFRSVWQNMPSTAQIFTDPMSASLPEDAATQYAVCTALSAATTANNVQQCFQYVDRFTQMGRAELSMLYVKDMQRRASNAARKAAEEGKPFDNPVQTAAYSQWAIKNRDLFA